MKVAVIGMGHFGPRRLAALARRPEVSSLVACDHHEHKLAPVLAAHPLAKVETSFDRVLSDPSVRAVVLCTPIPSHFELALAAIETGKDLFVEKPLATSGRGAEVLVEAAARRGSVLRVGHSFEHSSPAIAIREVLESDALGLLRYATMRRVNLGRHQRESSVLWDLAIHDVSFLLRLRPEDPTRLQLTGRAIQDGGPLEVAFLALEFPSGFMAHVEVSWLAPEKSRMIQLVGAEASLEYWASEGQENVIFYDRRVRVGGREPEYHRGEARTIPLVADAALEREMVAFLEAVARRNTSLADARHALRVIRVLEAAEEQRRRAVGEEIP